MPFLRHILISTKRILESLVGSISWWRFHSKLSLGLVAGISYAQDPVGIFLGWDFNRPLNLLMRTCISNFRCKFGIPVLSTCGGDYLDWKRNLIEFGRLGYALPPSVVNLHPTNKGLKKTRHLGRCLFGICKSSRPGCALY